MEVPSYRSAFFKHNIYVQKPSARLGDSQQGHEGEEEVAWESFLSSLPLDDCRYAVYRFSYQGNSKLLLVLW